MLFMKMDNYRHVDFCNNKQCENAIRSLDEIDIQMKELQQRYHVKFMNILPASKVLKVIRAEESLIWIHISISHRRNIMQICL
jgi:hypothetical protein